MAPASAAAESLRPPGTAGVPILAPDTTLAPSPAQGLRARLDTAGKRALDVAVSAALLTLLAPLIAFVAVLIRLDSPGPVFFRSHRIGYRGRTLLMLKFRKMQDNATGIALTLDNDERFTRVGAWLARLKIDEIPQLWQVLRGEMSLVGPRPEAATFVSRFAEEYDSILTAKPGVIGLSQIAFAEEGRILDGRDPVGHYLERIMPQKVRMDLMYVDRRSLGYDIRILLWASVAVMLRRQVAVRRSDGKMNLRKR